jgi:hypothetical protein
MDTWMTGTQANAQTDAVGNVAAFGAAIFGSVGANRYVRPSLFKHDDVVIVETARDNRALIAAGGTLLLAVVVLISLGR